MSAPESNAPEEFVVTTIICAVAALVIVTLAPLMNALEGSLTVPTMLPVAIVVWAKRGDTVPARIARTKPTETILAAFNMSAVFRKAAPCKRVFKDRALGQS